MNPTDVPFRHAGKQVHARVIGKVNYRSFEVAPPSLESGIPIEGGLP